MARSDPLGCKGNRGAGGDQVVNLKFGRYAQVGSKRDRLNVRYGWNADVALRPLPSDSLPIRKRIAGRELGLVSPGGGVAIVEQFPLQRLGSSALANRQQSGQADGDLIGSTSVVDRRWRSRIEQALPSANEPH